MAKLLAVFAKVQAALALFEGLHDAGIINLKHQPTIDHVTSVVSKIIADVTDELTPAAPAAQ